MVAGSRNSFLAISSSIQSPSSVTTATRRNSSVSRVSTVTSQSQRVSTLPPLKWSSFWANPSSEELGAQGPVPTLERPEGRSWLSLFLGRCFTLRPSRSNRQHQVSEEPHRRDLQRPCGHAWSKAGRSPRED